MAVILALATAACYGVSDFAAGLGSRRMSSGPVTAMVQFFGFVAAVISVLLFPGSGATTAVILWGALSGTGSALGTLALYHGLAVGRMSVVATVSAVVSAVVPVMAGVALGEHLSLPVAVGIAVAIPAIGLVSWQRDPDERAHGQSGLLEGVLAGVGFSVLFIALSQAGTDAGAWPLLPGQVVSVTLALPFAFRGSRFPRTTWQSALPLMILAGFLSGSANLLFLASTAHGELAVVAVISALYPAFTVLLARIVLAEHWSRLQAVGLLAAAAAVVLVGIA